MTGPAQLTLDGGEVPLETVAGESAGPLSEAQQLILRLAGRPEGVRSVEAGVVMHQARGHCASPGARWHNFRGGGIACCPYAPTDGLAALRRLAERGLVRRTEPLGTWRAR